MSTNDDTVDREAPTAAPRQLTRLKSQMAEPASVPEDGGGIGPYRRLEVLRPWRYGVIYKAYHPALDRIACLRVLAAEHAVHSAVSEEFLQRAAVLSKLNHPNVVSVLEAGDDRGVRYVAEEYFEGRPLGGFGPRTFRQRWREGMYPVDKLCRVMLDAASGLRAIHQAGTHHGRIGHQTIIVNDQGSLKLAGFFDESAPKTTQDDAICRSKSRERLGPDQRDIFDLGTCFYELVAGLDYMGATGRMDPEQKVLSSALSAKQARSC